MTPYFAAYTTVFEHAFLGSLGNHIQSGIIVALGLASFTIGTILRRTQSSRSELTDSQSYGRWRERVPAETPRGALATPAEAVPQGNPNVA